MIIVGIDPGITGAVAIFIEDELKLLQKLPVLQVGKKKHLDIQSLRKILYPWGYTYHVFIEKAQAMPGQGVTSMFNYGRTCGLIEGLCIGMHLAYTLVTPQAWKKVMMQGMQKEKDASIARAKQLFPGVSLLATEKSRKDDHNMADALLIVEYGRRLM